MVDDGVTMCEVGASTPGHQVRGLFVRRCVFSIFNKEVGLTTPTEWLNIGRYGIISVQDWSVPLIHFVLRRRSCAKAADKAIPCQHQRQIFGGGLLITAVIPQHCNCISADEVPDPPPFLYRDFPWVTIS